MSKQNEILKELVAVRIKKVLVTDKDLVYERNLYNRVGRGVTPSEYTEVIEKLIADGVVKRSNGARGSIVLSLVQ